eukprot:m.930908 g.930908  ORF g.930908 m.930908 type:complete len:324 (+) comp23783_c0_seq13:235-1206(+)
MKKFDSLLRGRRKSKSKSPDKSGPLSPAAAWTQARGEDVDGLPQVVNKDSFSVLDDDLDPDTEMAGWFLSGMSRSEVTYMAECIMDHGKPGEFIVRDKRGEPNVYALSVKGPNELRNEFLTYAIEKNPDPDGEAGYVLRGAEHSVFKTVSRLVAYYTEEKREELGVKLVHPGNYMSSYQSSGYATENPRPDKSPDATAERHKYSKGSLEAKVRAAGDELDDDDELPSGFQVDDDTDVAYDLASGGTDREPGVFVDGWLRCLVFRMHFFARLSVYSVLHVTLGIPMQCCCAADSCDADFSVHLKLSCSKAFTEIWWVQTGMHTT